jgi:hypothetical protein
MYYKKGKNIIVGTTIYQQGTQHPFFNPIQ